MRAILGTITCDKAAQLRGIADTKFTREECKEVVNNVHLFTDTVPASTWGGPS